LARDERDDPACRDPIRLGVGNLARPRSGLPRHHLTEDRRQRTIRGAAFPAGIAKRVSPQTVRHSFAADLLEACPDIHTLQTLLDHRDLEPTTIYTHILDRGSLAARRPPNRP